MGYEKDIQESQIKDMSVISGYDSRLFKDENSARAVGQIVKFASALYLVTSFVPDTDPIKVEIRGLAVDLIKDTTKTSLSGGEYRTREIISDIISLLDLSRMAGVVSVMNAEMLITFALDFLSRQNNIRSGDIGVSVREYLEGTTANNSVLDKKIIDETQSSKSRPSTKYPKQISSKPASKKVEDNHIRRNKILSFIKDKKRVSIREVSRIFLGLSEKTVQRELLEMVRLGDLRKEGERRWSVYTIA